jgi:hypothetical protein
MANNELILQKLLKVAENQQKAIRKLAQTNLSTPDKNGHIAMIDYINNGLIAVVAANSGLSGVHSEVKVNPDDTFMAYITGVPAKRREAFGRVLAAQIKAQKPELDGKFSYFFQE